MAEALPNDLTLLLQAIGRGEVGAGDRLLRKLYDDLRQIASAKLRGRSGDTLHATELVHEAYLQLFDRRSTSWENRRHFFFAAARAMQDVMIEQARRKGTAKRGRGWKRSELDELVVLVEEPGVDVLELDDVLAKLEATEPRKVELVRLRFFAGLKIEEAAEVLGISPRTALRDWRFIRARLFAELGDLPMERDDSGDGVGSAHAEDDS